MLLSSSPYAVSLGALNKEAGVPWLTAPWRASPGMRPPASRRPRVRRPVSRSRVGAHGGALGAAPRPTGLTVPTEVCHAIYKAKHGVFCVHHALQHDGMSRRPGVIQNFRSVLAAKFPVVDPKIRACSARTRTINSVKTVNARLAHIAESSLSRIGAFAFSPEVIGH